MNEYELKYYNNNYLIIAGVDEAGRGPLAGPVVAACVIFPKNVNLKYVNDSKKLSLKQRNLALLEIKEKALDISISIIDEKRIDEINILNATKEAMINAINNLKIKPDIVLIDAVKIEHNIKTKSIIKGDMLSYSIAAASIIAKTTRDEIMNEYNIKYPNYEFDKHKGYPTKKHIEYIRKYGITPIHRKSFNPIKSMLLNKNKNE